MLRTFTFLCCLAAAAPVSAQSAFTPAQRQEVVSIIREALKKDPSILGDAFQALEANTVSGAQAMLTARAKDLMGNPEDGTAGNPAGDVTIVEFYDPRCTYCLQMQKVMAAVMDKDKGVRLVYKDVPVLGPASDIETRIIFAAQKQGAYQKMQSALMATPAEPDPDMLLSTAKSLGLDAQKLATDMGSPDITAHIKRNLALAHDLKLVGTPIFIVGSQVIVGATEEADLESAVKAARKHG
jgi:protein-disulfide isomerase